MRWLPCLVSLVMLGGCRPTLDEDAIALATSAQRTFDTARNAADYIRAASQYQSLVDRGVESGAIFYNQGNAYMRGGERGRAIACYRRSLRYRPTDARLVANLQLARGLDAPVPARPLLEYLFFWQNYLSYPAKFQVSLASAAVTFLLALISLWVRQVSCRRAAFAMLTATLVLSSSAAYDWYRFDFLRHGVIVARETTARKGNDESYEPAFTAPLPEGTEFTVVETGGRWLLIQLGSGDEAWVPTADTVTY